MNTLDEGARTSYTPSVSKLDKVTAEKTCCFKFLLPFNHGHLPPEPKPTYPIPFPSTLFSTPSLLHLFPRAPFRKWSVASKVLSLRKSTLSDPVLPPVCAPNPCPSGIHGLPNPRNSVHASLATSLSKYGASSAFAPAHCSLPSLTLFPALLVDMKASTPSGMEAGSSSSGSASADAISRIHRMTLDEASLILNIKKGAIVEETELQKMLKVSFLVLFVAWFALGARGRRKVRS